MTLVLLEQPETPAIWDAVRSHLGGVPVLLASAAGVLDELDRAGVARATIAGCARGAGAALALALDQPGRVAGLGLVAPDVASLEPMRDRLWEIRCRTQILTGAENARPIRMLAERISAARYLEYPAGQMLPNDRPAEVAGELAVLWAASLDGRVSRTRGSSSLGSAGGAGSPLPAD